MQIPKKYLHDKFVLLLVSANVFIAFLCIMLILLRMGVGQGSDDYIVQYRSNLGISAFKSGGLWGIVSFIFFDLLVLLLSIALSMRTFMLRRSLSMAILGLSTFLLLASLIVSNSLLVLR